MTKAVCRLAKCHSYLVAIGIHFMDANEIIGRYSLDKIRAACLTMKDNNVNVINRKAQLLFYLKET
jgi:hypothetical protein